LVCLIVGASRDVERCWRFFTIFHFALVHAHARLTIGHLTIGHLTIGHLLESLRSEPPGVWVSSFHIRTYTHGLSFVPAAAFAQDGAHW